MMARIAMIMLAALAAPLPALAEPKTNREAFLAADANGDMKLDARELKTFIGHMARLGEQQAQKVKRLGAYGAAMRTLDTDGDGFASVAELRAQE